MSKHKKQQLKNLQASEVSLVDRAANKRRFLILKNEEGEDSMSKNELVLEVSADMETVLKSVADADETVLSAIQRVLKGETAFASDLVIDLESEAIEKAKLSEKAARAVKMALGALKGAKDEMPKDIMSKLAELGNYEAPVKEKQESKSEAVKKNEDGTLDLSGIPEDSRAMVEFLYKQSTDNSAKVAELKSILKAERDSAELKASISEASEFKNLSIEPSKFGCILKAVKEKLSEEESAEVMRVLKSADEAINLAPAGADGGEDSTDAYSKLEKIAKSIAESDNVTFEQAFVKALDQNPELAKEQSEEHINKGGTN